MRLHSPVVKTSFKFLGIMRKRRPTRIVAVAIDTFFDPPINN